MSGKTIRILGAIIAALLLVLFVLRSNDSNEPVTAGGSFLPEFRAVANDVGEIRIAKSSDDESLLLQRDGDDWVVRERDNYPADVSKIRALMIALADAEIVEEKTANPDNYSRLGVDDPADGGSGTGVILSGQGFTHAVVLGNQAQGDSRYARTEGNTTSYLIDKNPSIPANIGDWLIQDVIDIAASRVRRVSTRHAGGDTIVIEKSEAEQTDFVVNDIPAGQELSYATVANGIGGALATLTLDDARAAVSTATAATTTVFDTWNGLQITAEVSTEDEAFWVAFSATADAESTAAADDETAQAEEPSPVDEAREINERLSGWQYRLADYKKDLLVRRWDDILKALVSEQDSE